MPRKKAKDKYQQPPEKEENELPDDESAESKYPCGWDDEDVKRALLLIGFNNADKTTRDKQNLAFNDLRKEASNAQDPTKPRYIGAKKADQAVRKTAERLQPASYTLQGDGADEIENILVTKAVKEALHRGKFDWTYTSKGGVTDKILSYGNANRLIQVADKEKTSFPVEFSMIDSNNIWVNTNATTFRNGNKCVTELVALFNGTKREFDDKFPQFKGKVKAGLIPRAFSYKDLDQTATQKFRTSYSTANDDDQAMEWAYAFDLVTKSYIFFAGTDLSILEKKKGDGKDGYPYKFKNLEGKEECYVPVSNYMCLPAVEGIYDVGIIALLYDMCIVFRRTINGVVGLAEENVHPHTLVNIPEGQEASFFNLWEMASQMGAAGENAIIPLTFNPSNPGQISNAQAITNGGDVKLAQALMEMINNEFRQCGVYLDEPLNSDLTEEQIQLQASAASSLPKAITKYNAPEVEFEVMVAIDILKREIKKGDKTPLILEPKLDTPDGEYSLQPDKQADPNNGFDPKQLTLGWLKHVLNSRTWKVIVDPVSGAVTDNHIMINFYKSIMQSMDPASPAYSAITSKIALLMGIKIPSTPPAPQGGQAGPPGGGGQISQPSPTGQPVGAVPAMSGMQ